MFFIPDGCITLTQFYLGVLVLTYLLCLFCITNFDVLLTYYKTRFCASSWLITKILEELAASIVRIVHEDYAVFGLL